MNTSVSNYDGLRVATLAVLLGSLPVNALRDVGYPGTSFEVLLVTAVAILLGSALGFLTKKSTVYFYILGLGAYAFVDTSFLNLATNQVFAAVLIIVLIIGAFRVLGDVVLPYILVFCIVFFGSSVIGERPALLNITGGAPASEPAPDRSILHIVLDEQGSPFNVAYRPPESHPAAKILEDYADWGFQVHSQAHSRTPFTRHTLSSIMALDPDNQKVQKNKSGAEFSYVAERNSYLEELLRQGYSVSVLQTSYIDFCLGNEAIRCATYSRVGHSSGFDDYGSIARFRIAFRSMLSAFRGPQRSNILLYRIADREIYARRPKLSNYLPLVAHNLLEERVFETASEIEPGKRTLFI